MYTSQNLKFKKYSHHDPVRLDSIREPVKLCMIQLSRSWRHNAKESNPANVGRKKKYYISSQYIVFIILISTEQTSLVNTFDWMIGMLRIAWIGHISCIFLPKQTKTTRRNNNNNNTNNNNKIKLMFSHTFDFDFIFKYH